VQGVREVSPEEERKGYGGKKTICIIIIIILTPVLLSLSLFFYPDTQFPLIKN